MDYRAVEYSPELPEPIILLIQSLVNPEHAAQTTLLSKSWLRARSTRPTIDLDETHFPEDHSSPFPEIHRLAVFAKKTFRRYEDQNLRIDTFRLSLNTEWYCRSGLATKWTSKALKLGATDFTFRSVHENIEIPLRVVLESENVVRRLCLEESNIRQLKVIRCMGLKSLELINTVLYDSSFFDIILCCPLIENLSLSNVDAQYDNDQRAAGSKISLPNLTSLSLYRWQQLEGVFLDNLSSKFPNLKELTVNIRLYSSYGATVISSSSLEIFNLRSDGHYNAELEIDLPRIRKFTFKGSVIPNFSVGSKSGDQFESRVSIISHEGLRADWLYKLREFLTSMHMAGSTTHLCLHLHCKNISHYLVGDVECVNVCEVEDLTVETRDLSPTLSSDVILDVLIRICCPKMITPYSSPAEKEYCGICDQSSDENSDESSD